MAKRSFTISVSQLCSALIVLIVLSALGAFWLEHGPGQHYLVDIGDRVPARGERFPSESYVLLGSVPAADLEPESLLTRCNGSTDGESSYEVMDEEGQLLLVKYAYDDPNRERRMFECPHDSQLVMTVADFRDAQVVAERLREHATRDSDMATVFRDKSPSGP